MIQPKELRIGNIVEVQFDTNDFTTTYIEKGEDIDNFENLRAIPLSEEWLKKAGFENIKHIAGYEFYHHGQHKLSVYLDSSKRIEWKGYMVNCKLEVHSLQNLYFALTGKELEFK